MSWYADIDGEVVISLKAKPLVMKIIGQWTEPDASGAGRGYSSCGET